MDELEVLRILNKYNPWWSDAPIPPSKTCAFKRAEFHAAKKELTSREILSIIGPRRVGKTILIHQLVQDLLNKTINPKRILYLSVDEVELSKQNAELKDILDVYSKFVLKTPLDSLQETHFLFLDEIQETPNWEKILKNWWDFRYNLKFIISGSSSIWITKGTEESLLGRIKTHLMLPMKFSEILRYRKILPENFFTKQVELRDALIEAVNKNNPVILYEFLKDMVSRLFPAASRIQIELNRYLIVGGYPEFLDDTDYSRISEAIRDKVKLIFFKDIVRYFRIKNPKVLEDLFKILAKSSGELFNLTSTANILDIHRPTLRSYLTYLTKAYLIRSSEFYSESRRKRVRKQDKIYVLDPGIRNGVVDYLDEYLPTSQSDMGLVVQSVLFDHLTRLKYNITKGPEPTIYYWHNKKEIDFVLDVKRKAIPVESKHRSAVKRETMQALGEFIHSHDSPFGMIITKDNLGYTDNILKIPLWLLLTLI